MDASVALTTGLAIGFAVGMGVGLLFYLFMRRIDQALAVTGERERAVRVGVAWSPDGRWVAIGPHPFTVVEFEAKPAPEPASPDAPTAPEPPAEAAP